MYLLEQDYTPALRLKALRFGTICARGFTPLVVDLVQNVQYVYIFGRILIGSHLCTSMAFQSDRRNGTGTLFDISYADSLLDGMLTAMASRRGTW